jgi:Domain of unknown function (DUF1707)
MAYADGKSPDMRASDAERDAIVADLGQHFQDGRLDHAEFDQRVTDALAAKTRGHLATLLADLPPAVPAPAGQVPHGRPGQPGPLGGRPRVLAFLPLALAVLLITAAASHGWHHGGAGGWPYAPFGFLWLVVPVLAVRLWIRGTRRRQRRG